MLRSLFCLILFFFACAQVQAQDCPDSCGVDVPKYLPGDGDCYDCYSFKVKSNCTIEKLHLTVFNRWGIMVFESDDQEKMFSSSDAKEDGSYMWYLELTFCDDREWKGNGQVIVLR